MAMSTTERVVARYLAAQAPSVQELITMLESDRKAASQAEDTATRAAKKAIEALRALARKPGQPVAEIKALTIELVKFEHAPTIKHVREVGGMSYGFALSGIEDEADMERPERQPILKLISDIEETIGKLREHIERKYVGGKLIRALGTLAPTLTPVQRYRALMDEILVTDRPYSTSLQAALKLLRTWASEH